MNAASASQPRARRTAARRGSRAAAARPPAREAGAARVRWDRLARIALLCVLAALLYLYMSAGFHMFSTWRQSGRAHGAVTALEREHRVLAVQHQALAGTSTLEVEARQLGMMHRGEQSYVIMGLPAD
jgi:hypothetical protein